MANGFLIFFSLSRFTIPFGSLHTAARHTYWSAPPLPLGLFCSLAIAHSVTMSWLFGTSIAVMEERISGRHDLFQFLITHSASVMLLSCLVYNNDLHSSR